jgi:hypothetical protein
MTRGNGIVLLAAGGLLIVAGLIAWLYDQRLRELKAWDRPRWALRAAYRTAFSTARRLSVVAGWLLLASASPAAAAVVGVVIVGGWLRIRWVRTDGYTARRLRAEMATLRRRHPECDEGELLGRIVLARHPEWGSELADRIVTDNPTLPGLARVLNRMERGRFPNPAFGDRNPLKRDARQ